MKLLVIIFSFLFASSAFAATTGTVPLGDMRLSLRSTAAFADFSSPNILTSRINKQITICSVTAPTQCATGWIKAVGAGETYNDLVGGADPNYRNGDFESGETDWAIGTGFSISGGIATGVNVLGNKLNQTTALALAPPYRFNRLYRLNYTNTTSTGNFKEYIGGFNTATRSAGGTYTTYFTFPSSGGNNELYFTSTGDAFSWSGTLDNVTFQEVIAPSATGVTIVSTEGGTTQNWASNTFTTQTYDPAGFTYSIEGVDYSLTVSGNNNTLSYGVVDCNNAADTGGILVSGTGNTIQNYTVVRCPAGAFQFDESATLINSIGISSGADITIAAGKTVTGKNNLFGDEAESGDGTYTDVGSATQWGQDPDDVFVDYAGGDFHLKAGSPAIDAGIRP